MTDSELCRSVIEDFWNWVQKNKDDVAIEFHERKKLYLYVAFDREALNSFTSEYQAFCEEGGCPSEIQMNDICIDAEKILGGYGFTMQDVWNARPAGIENELGKNIW